METYCQLYLDRAAAFAAEKREHLAQLKEASALARAALAENISY